MEHDHTFYHAELMNDNLQIMISFWPASRRPALSPVLSRVDSRGKIYLQMDNTVKDVPFVWVNKIFGHRKNLLGWTYFGLIDARGNRFSLALDGLRISEMIGHLLNATRFYKDDPKIVRVFANNVTFEQEEDKELVTIYMEDGARIQFELPKGTLKS